MSQSALPARFELFGGAKTGLAICGHEGRRLAVISVYEYLKWAERRMAI